MFCVMSNFPKGFQNYEHFVQNYKYFFQSYKYFVPNDEQFIRNFEQVVKETKICEIIFCFKPKNCFVFSNSTSYLGYGNIAPKTKWGRIVTMIYATFGMPIFLMWVSNMGTLLAQTFTFLYSHVCCFVCKQGKKRKVICLRG